MPEKHMADEEQLRILKQGVEAWNAWRRQDYQTPIDLSFADLNGASLVRAELTRANLCGANLCGANLSDAILEGADLDRAKLSRANLSEAKLREANFFAVDLSEATLHWACLLRADLTRANLCGANLFEANLRDTAFRGADLRRADLRRAGLVMAGLDDADLHEALLDETILSDVDLSSCKNLETIRHHGPSTIDIRTLQRSGRLPLAFLRGVGLPDILIEYLPSLLGQAIQHYSCFISYASKDDAFVRRLHADLQDKGVRCWFAPHDMKIGAKIIDTLDEAIRLRDKVLLVLSEASIASGWVEDEMTKAFAEERQRGGVVLFPVRVDDAVLTTSKPWALKLRDNRHIGDFRAWKDHDAYQKALDRVLRDLRVEAPD
jgi:uncharacterized protein YjbI with pentapeptide repeats